MDKYFFYHMDKMLQCQNIAGTIMMTYQKRFSSIFIQNSGNILVVIVVPQLSES